MVDSLISIAVEKLNTILQDEVALFASVTNDIKKLSSTFELIQAMLEDAESQRLKKNKEVTIWLEKIKDVAYDVDDIIDEWTTSEALRSQATDEGDVSCFSKNNVRSFLSPVTCFNHVMLRHRIGSRIREARGRLDDIAKDMNQLGLSVSVGERVRMDTQVRQNENRIRETSSLVDRLSIVGREDDKNKILDLLLSESSQEVTEVPFVISIVGMGGLGKTSLAKLVYNDDKLKEERFPVKMWVCVSENFDVKQITKLMLVLESEIWNLADVMEGILPALLLSYYDLPPALKQCFAYCSIFPKDWEIKKDKIVKLWVAQGFISSDTSKEMEEIGGLYFDDLLKRSLLQDAGMDDDGKIFKCKMHDLVHDLAQFVAGNDCSIMKITQGAMLNLNKVHHSSLTFTGSAFQVTSIPSTFYKVHKLRTLLIFPESELSIYLALRLLKMSEMEKARSCSVLHNLFHHLRCLRALEMRGVKISRLPRTVRQLKQLRYLDLSGSLIEELSEELIDCINLQSLILNFCYFLKRLPREMRKLISLRHLELYHTPVLGYLPKGIGRLTSLQTLTEFIVGGNDGCELGELKHLNLLRGSLYISQLQKAMLSQDDAMQADLYKKAELHTLILSYEYGEVVGDEEKRRAEVVLQGLQPHTNLKVLKIWRYRGSKFPDWMGDPSFSNLISVELSDCTECEELPPLWNLPTLRKLGVYGCPLLKERYKEGGDDRHKIAHISDLVVV